MKVASADSYLQYGASLRSQFIQDPEVVRIWMAGINDLESLKGDERVRFTFLMLNSFYAFQNTFLHAREGVVDPEFWKADETVLRGLLRLSGIRTWWRTAHVVLTTTFVNHVNSLLDETLQSESGTSAGREPAG